LLPRLSVSSPPLLTSPPPLPVWSLLLPPHYPARNLVSFSQTTFTAARSPHGPPWVGSPLWIASFPYLIPPSSPLSAPALPLAHDLQISQNLSPPATRTIGSFPPKLLPVHFKGYITS
jgi:hypothetical protein